MSRFQRNRRPQNNPSGQVNSAIFGETVRVIEGDDLILTLPQMMSGALPGLMKTKYSIVVGAEIELKVIDVIRTPDQRVVGGTVNVVPALDAAMAHGLSQDNTMYSAVPFLVALSHSSSAAQNVQTMIGCVSALLRQRSASHAVAVNCKDVVAGELVIAYVNGTRETGSTFKLGAPSAFNASASTIPTQPNLVSQGFQQTFQPIAQPSSAFQLPTAPSPNPMTGQMGMLLSGTSVQQNGGVMAMPQMPQMYGTNNN